MAGVGVVTNLERIGDHCAGIGRLVVGLGGQPTVPVPTEFETMAIVGQRLTRSAMTAFATFDENLSQTVIARDGEIDRLHDQVCKRLMTTMTSDPTMVKPGMLLLWVSHNFERIGDRATNIARPVAYLVKGDLTHNPDATD